MLSDHLLPRKGNYELTLYCFLFVLYCGCHVPLEICNDIPKENDLLEVIAINGGIIFKCF
jgi:hypothetical protein